MNTYKENFGLTGTDKITGFTGIVTGYIEYLYGCEQYFLVPKVKKDGKRAEGEWFDVARIKMGGKKVILERINATGAEFNNEKYPFE